MQSFDSGRGRKFTFPIRLGVTFLRKSFVDKVTKNEKKRLKTAFFEDKRDFFSTPPCAAY